VLRLVLRCLSSRGYIFLLVRVLVRLVIVGKGLFVRVWNTTKQLINMSKQFRKSRVACLP
jgi:hypothetical protein